MADTKISALAALTGANVEQLADVIPIVDTSVTTTKKILVSELSQAMRVLGTAVATTSGTEHDFTIPAWAKMITVMLVGVSGDGTSPLLIQTGDAGGIETSGYTSTARNTGGGSTDSSAGFILEASGVAASAVHGFVTLFLENSSAFTWVSGGNLFTSGNTLTSSAGSKSLSAALTTVRITHVNGTDAFDAGAVNVQFA
jgi:hypothetical protein